MRRDPFVAFIRLSRPKFLLESLLTVILGVAVAVHEGYALRLGPYLLAQACVSGTHLMTHYCNEYFDLAADSGHNAPNAWTGGSQVLAKGLLKPATSLAAAFIALFMMLWVLVAMPSAGARTLALAGITLAWFYTAPPLRLNHRGFGEITTAAVLTVLCPDVTCYLQMGTVPPLLLAMSAPLLLFMTARMMVMNFCDRDSDLAAGKRTLPNVLGAARAAQLFTAIQIVGYTGTVVLTGLGLLPWLVGLALLSTAPLAYWLCRALLHRPPGDEDPQWAVRVALGATVHAAATAYLSILALIAVTIWPQVRDGSVGGSALACAGLFVLYTGLFVGQQALERSSRATDRIPVPVVAGGEY